MKPTMLCFALLLAGALAVGPAGCDKDEPGPSADPADRQAQPAGPPPGRVALDLELPKPSFTGTPKHIRAENLEAARRPGQPVPTVFVPEEVISLARGREVTTNVPAEMRAFELSNVTDGSKKPGEYVILAGQGPRWIQIDLGRDCEIFAVAIWHSHDEGRVYRDVIVQLGSDPEFFTEGEDFVTIFNNDHDNSSGMGVGTDKAYVDDHEGKVIDAGGRVARYVRLYANGFDTNAYSTENRYTEVEVYGREPKGP
jgi:hypothetical protein